MTIPKTILHVDDDPDDRFLVGDAIHKLDPTLRIIEAESGLKAIALLKKAVVAGELPALIILDFNMPRMNGMETYKEIRKYPEFCEIPVVLLTTVSNKQEEDYWDNESVATFTKPYTMHELSKSIKEILAVLRVRP